MYGVVSGLTKWDSTHGRYQGDDGKQMDTRFMVLMVLVLAVVLGCQTGAQASASEDQVAPIVASMVAASSPACPMAGKSVTDANRAIADSNGPTVLLSYGKGTLEQNPIRSFMYFVPLISPVAVDRGASPGNHQQAAIISCERKVTSRSFCVTCEFEMTGKGFSRYTFDPTGMIVLRIAESKKPKGEPLSRVLNYINFEGEGFGRIQIKGTIAGTCEAVTEVELEFNARGRRSPVTIGLYELKAKEGQYRYENRSGEIVARVNTLTFKRSENPRMDITVASIAKKAGANGPIEQLKAAIANLFIKPVKVDPLGNETLLHFGYALFEQKPTFTFPKAGNLKEATVLAYREAEPRAEPQGQ
jgi:hypothetical protein